MKRRKAVKRAGAPMRRVVSRRDFLKLGGTGVAGLAFLGAAGCGPATEQGAGGGGEEAAAPKAEGPVIELDKSMEWRMGSILAADNAVVEASERFADIVAQRTDGKLQIRVVPGGALGEEIAQRDAVANGTLEMTNIGLPLSAPDEPRLDLFNLYYLWESRDHMMKVVAGEIGEEVYESYRKNSGIKILAANWQMGTRHTIVQKSVKTPEDFSGVKIRVTEGIPIYSDLWSAMGANPVPLPFPEAYGALEQGVVDSVELPLDIMYQEGFHELGKYLSLTEHYYYVNSVQVNDELFLSLPKEAQTMLVEAAQEAGKYSSQLVLEQQEQFQQQIADDGIEVVETDIGAFRKSVQPVYAKHMDTWGRDFYERVKNAA
jgi:TRAP-type transport system periplasmic protein